MNGSASVCSPDLLQEHRPASTDTWPNGHGPTLVSETCPGECCACVVKAEKAYEKFSSWCR